MAETIIESNPAVIMGKLVVTGILDESGEDYRFPASFFVPIDDPKAAERVFPRAV